MVVGSTNHKLWAYKGLYASRIYRVGRKVMDDTRGKANLISGSSGRAEDYKGTFYL